MENVTSNGKNKTSKQTNARGSTLAGEAFMEAWRKPRAPPTGGSQGASSPGQKDGHVLGISFLGPPYFSLRAPDNLWPHVPNLSP